METSPGQDIEQHMVRYARVMLWDGFKVLVLHNTKRNRWEFPGGKAERLESIHGAAKREVLEETGLKIGELTFVNAIPRVFADHEACGFYYAALTWCGELELEPQFDEARWVTLDELAELVQIPMLCVDIARLYRSEK